MSFFAYYQVSTKQQAQSRLSLEVQRSTVEGYLSDRAGMLLSEFIEVEGRTKKDRPELKRAIREYTLTCAKLIIAKLDRLSRNVHF
jgi:DNA invertase Pin-like site-specific DNA recombinase